MRQLKCIIVDDERVSLDVLERYALDCPQLKLLCRCKNAFEALEVLNEQEVDVIFLDINMPKLSGMSFYKSLQNPPMVVFTTAYPQYAVEGFEVDAVDYLLKPFSFERFLQAVNKAYAKLDDNKASAYVLLRADKKVHRIAISDIDYLKAVGDYVKVKYGEQHILVHSTFQNILNALPEKDIVRVHKSYAVALDKIELFEGNMLRLKGQELPIGASYRVALMALLER